jgi:transposase-like protein
MIHAHSSTVNQRVHWVSELIAEEASYGVVSQMSRKHEVSRQTLYSWKARYQQRGAWSPWMSSTAGGKAIHEALQTDAGHQHPSTRCMASVA